MASVSARQRAAALERKGFRRKEGNHHYFSFYRHGQLTAVGTMISHGARDIPTSIVSKIARQMRITPAQLHAFVECSLSEQDYGADLEARQEIGRRFGS